MAYSQTTLNQLISAISVALDDPTNIYWSTTEINLAIQEFLLWWGGMTSAWRDRGTFTTTANVAFYDMSQQLSSLRTRSVTLDTLIQEMQYALLEPAAGLAGTGMTTQFSMSQITAALARARNQFALDARLPYTFGGTSLTWDQATQIWNFYTMTWNQLGSGVPFVSAIGSPPISRLTIDESVIAISRVSWLESITGTTKALWREDAYGAQANSPTWTTPGVPVAYSISETPVLELQLIPPASGNGMISALWVDSLTIDTTSATETFDIPDEFSAAIKWHAMYELLSTNSVGADPFRAKYAYERYRSIVEASKMMRSVLRVQVGSTPVQLDTLQSLDAGRLSWENRSGTPNMAATVYDVLALSDVPSATLTITCDVVRTAPLPASGSAKVQLGPEEIAYLIDYVRHVLMFKLGGIEFQSTFALYDNVLLAAAQRNKLLGSRCRFLKDLFEQPQKQEATVPAA